MTDQVEATAIVTRPEQQALAPRNMSPGQLASVLIEKENFDVEKLARLMELQKDYDAQRKAEAYANAILNFQAMCPTIIRTGYNTNFKNQFAQWDPAYEQMLPSLKQCQISISHRVNQPDRDLIIVEAVADHMGHKETCKMSGPPDRLMSKDGRAIRTEVQAIKSTVSYLKWVTASALLGLRSRDRKKDEQIPENVTAAIDAEDDDGNSGGSTPPHKPKAQELADEAKAKAEGKLTPKQQFIVTCQQKSGYPNMPLETVKKAFAAVSKILALTDPALCLEYIQRPDVEVHDDGTVTKKE